MTIYYFFESLLSVTYKNKVIHGSFYFVYHTFRPEFTFVDTSAADF